MMGSYDGAEVCELVDIYVLNTLANKYDKNNIGLYRDDGLAAFKTPQAVRQTKSKRILPGSSKSPASESPSKPI